jgi:hypothetical protein
MVKIATFAKRQNFSHVSELGAFIGQGAKAKSPSGFSAYATIAAMGCFWIHSC